MTEPSFEMTVDFQVGNRSRLERQRAVAAWCVEMFGADHAASAPQRVLRLLEETLELAQSVGLELHSVDNCSRYVYGRPPGDPARELAQVGVVLLSVAEALGVDADAAEAAEFSRVQTKSREHWQERNDEKNAAGLRVTK